MAMIQDLGGTFGPLKLDLQGWAKSPVWTDPRSCMVSMRGLPYEGSTFPDTRISEEGRQFPQRASDRSRRNRSAISSRARASHQYPLGEPDVDRWVSAFQHRVRAITDRGPCPA